MKQTRRELWKRISTMVLILLLLITMIPVTDAWADVAENDVTTSDDMKYQVFIRTYDADGECLVEGWGAFPSTVTLGEIYGDKWIEKLEDHPKLGKFLGWTYSGSDEIVDKDTVVSFTEQFENWVTLYPKYEKEIIYVSYIYWDGKETKTVNMEEVITEEKLTYGQLADMVECPANQKYIFTGWRGVDGELDENILVKDMYVTLIAEYDKYPIKVDLAFLDNQGDLKVINEVVDFPHGTTYGDILNTYATNETEWLVSGNYYSLTDEISIDRNYIESTAQYEDKQIVYYSYSWIADADNTTEYGVRSVESGYVVVDKDVAASEELLMEEMNKVVKVDHFDKFPDVDFTINAVDEFDAYKGRDGYIDKLSINFRYNETLVNLSAYRENGSSIFDHYYIVEQEETFYFPLEYEGEKVYWLLLADNINTTNEKHYYTGSYVIPYNKLSNKTYKFIMKTEMEDGATLHENPTLPSEPDEPSEPGEPSKPDEPSEPSKPDEPSEPGEPSKPDKPGEPSKPDKPSEPGEPSKPDEPNEPGEPSEPIEPDGQTKPSEPSAPDNVVVELEEEKLEETKNRIEEAIKAEKPVQVVIDMKNEDGAIATKIPKEILEALKGHMVSVVFDMHNYSWIINGADISETDFIDINMEVKVDTSNIPFATVNQLANGQDTLQLSLTHNGDFGFKAELNINVGKDNKDKYANLYYYDTNKKLVFMDTGKIDENGTVSLEFSHASEYVLVIGEEIVVPQTGDSTNVTMCFAFLLVGAILSVVAMKKQNVI